MVPIIHIIQISFSKVGKKVFLVIFMDREKRFFQFFVYLCRNFLLTLTNDYKTDTDIPSQSDAVDGLTDGRSDTGQGL